MPRNPYDEALKHGLTIKSAPLADGMLGLYTGKSIIIAPDLSPRVERCVIAHELGHHAFDAPFMHAHQYMKAERRADRYAAEMLLDEGEVRRLSRFLDPGELALELGVTGWVLRAFLEAHPLAVASAV